MKTHWLINNNSKKLIIFFNGWSLDENIVKHIVSPNYDVLMFYDYQDLNISEEILSEIQNYEEKNIIAWSFGVWACSIVSDKFKNLKMAVAINGTPIPIDNTFGIAEKIFNFTLKTLSEQAYLAFYKNMFKSFDENCLNGLSNRDIENKRQELVKIQEISSRLEFLPQQNNFNKAFVGVKDKIITAKNQLNFWSEQAGVEIFKLNEGHCIFNLFKTWDEIINYEQN